jgi:hypothetical protein
VWGEYRDLQSEMAESLTCRFAALAQVAAHMLRPDSHSVTVCQLQVGWTFLSLALSTWSPNSFFQSAFYDYYKRCGV